MYTEDKGAPVYTLTRRNLKECKDELWERYGEDYQILSKQQDFKGGFLGFGQKEVVTVSYTVRSRGMPQRSLSKNSYSSYRNDDFQKNQEEILKMTTGNIDSIKQIAQVKQSVEELTNLINKKFEMSVSAAPDKHPSIAKIEEMLDRNEFSFAYISEISKRMSQEFSLDQLDDFDFVEKTVVDWIGESISVHPEKRFRPPHVIILVGPTGVGKTTTIAKLAANLILDAKDKGRERPQLRFISIDKTRVGALEQLVNYGEIMNVPVDKAETLEDVKTIYNEYRNRVDAILIDTSGYSPNDAKNIGQMRSILDLEDLHADVYLALSATTKARDLVNIIQNYEPFNFNSVIVTKCDETRQYGNVISVLHEKRKSISYITDGQRVPKNIRRADVVNFLIGLNDFKIDRTHIDDKFGVN
ncbi:MAG: flagellar biosynthesis protein FlhF [Treponema sp.]|nr:flagellar biosynthesis protein FlhF [Spirochaetia bacterium]MDD6295304.1 flagellar biosynthesis protein FlhF [Treponema sp.]MDD7449978.1 flagellar biosynthesis protein FlhF [Treponema sp.]MDY2923481.1 flagellar biosynthesis protein FlhF [Treponema sp.]MDY5684055.1 flagellar biosynthesis protein FlhF [Treponema sp.]